MTVRLTRSSLARLLTAVIALAGGILAATAVSSSGASSQVVTLGDVSGTPHQSICPAAPAPCTYLSFSSGNTAELQVPFDGTVTGFSVNSATVGGTVELRILRPLPNGQYTAAGTSAAGTLAAGVNTYATSLPVKAGDVIGLDNGTNAILFDDSSVIPDVQYFPSGLADGQSGAPTGVEGGYRLLLSATVQAAATSTTTGSTSVTTTNPATTAPTTSTTTTPHPTPRPAAPRLSGVSQSHGTWTEPRKHGKPSGPVGTTFSFRLNAAAQVHLRFSEQLPGRRVHGRCVVPTPANHSSRACKRSKALGALNPHGHSGANHVTFTGHLSGTTFAPGNYLVRISATSAGRSSRVATLAFTIRAPAEAGRQPSG